MNPCIAIALSGLRYASGLHVFNIVSGRVIALVRVFKPGWHSA